MAVTEAASCSGGEFSHRSKGFIFVISLGIGVPRLGISIGLDKLFGPGDTVRGARTFPLRRALAIQFEICVLLRPVCFCKVSLSSSVGYGRR